MLRRLTTLAVIGSVLALGPQAAHATSPEVVEIRLDYDVPPGGLNGPPEPAPPPEPPRREEPTFLLGWDAIVQQLDPSLLPRHFRRPGVAALGELRVPRTQLDSSPDAMTGGLAYTLSGRPTRYLRLPEVRFQLAGGPVSGPSTPLPGDSGLSLKPDHSFTARFEIGFGFQVPFEHLVPYALLLGGRSRYAVVMQVHHEVLGVIGHERATGGRWEANVELGVEVPISELVRAVVGYRHALVGPGGHGGVIGIRLTPDG